MEERIRQQFSIRIATYEKAAAWMLSPLLEAAQTRAAGSAPIGNNRALDLCCGTGIVGRSLLPLGWKMTGIDLTPEMVEVTRAHFPAEVGSVDRLPFADASFDLAILRQAYMLVDGPRTLREIRRVLAPRGRFILIQAVSFTESSAEEARYRDVQWARHINMNTYYRESDLVAQLNARGFTVEAVDHARVRENVDHWVNSAPELAPALRRKIRGLVADAPTDYRQAHRVALDGEDLFEDWNWVILTARKEEATDGT